MIQLISAYERRLRRLAEETPPSRRLNAVYAAFFPWVALVMVACVVIQVLGPSHQIAMLILVPVAALSAAGAGYAGLRVTAYGWRFDRTPPAAPWTETENGVLLIQALRRVTLNGLYAVTPETRLRRDLRLTREDLSALFAILGLQLDDNDPSVAALLAAIDSSGRV